ncbi:unnamed protein product [Callosobruchus maculatus]|uniref:Uncharacterized protein n=1 Tax=Callosobruchus maculatus TaxID=64391 RepID=A0A653DN86_CALMS|nr:unnamed protein product [Callosobruchus maculatus]
MGKIFSSATVLIGLLHTILCSMSATAIAADDGSFELSDGNCTALAPGDLVHMEHVHKLAIPFMEREATVKWYGDGRIYCVLVTSYIRDTRSTVKLLDGGAGHSFVILELHSSRGYGFEYQVRIFGKTEMT